MTRSWQIIHGRLGICQKEKIKRDGEGNPERYKISLGSEGLLQEIWCQLWREYHQYADMKTYD